MDPHGWEDCESPLAGPVPGCERELWSVNREIWGEGRGVYRLRWVSRGYASEVLLTPEFIEDSVVYLVDYLAGAIDEAIERRMEVE